MFAPPGRQKRAEVRVRGHEDAFVLTRSVENLVVVGRLKAVVPHVCRVVAGIGEPSRDHGRERVVGQKLQLAGASGSSRSRRASAA